jgi:hypothetical protein
LLTTERAYYRDRTGPSDAVAMQGDGALATDGMADAPAVDTGRVDVPAMEASVDGQVDVADATVALEAGEDAGRGDAGLDVPTMAMDGGCRGGCSGGLTCCNDHCVSLLRNESHCGTCGHSCGSDEVCQNGRCGHCLLVHFLCSTGEDRCCVLGVCSRICL